MGDIIDAGDTHTTSIEVWTAPPELGGTLTNAGTVALTVEIDFDGSVITPTPVNTSTGKYKYDYLTSAALPGRVTFRWVTTTPSTAHTDEIFVNAADPGLFISETEASNHLRAGGIITTTADREQLRWLCSVACDSVEKDLGLTIARRSITATFDGGRYDLNLQQPPPRAADGGSITITTVTENGTALTASDYVLRKQGWRLSRGSTTWRSPWASGIENIAVTYTAGCAVPPPCVRYAALGEVQGLWQSSQQATHPGLEGFDAEQAIARAAPGISGAMWGAYKSLRPLLYA